MQQLSKKESNDTVKAALKGLWVPKDPDKETRFFGLLDNEYLIPTQAELDIALKTDVFINAVPSRPEVYDCDDYALHFKAAAATYARTNGMTAGMLIGIGWGSFSWTPETEHVCNWVYLADGQFLWIEPQWLNVPGRQHVRARTDCLPKSLRCILA